MTPTTSARWHLPGLLLLSAAGIAVYFQVRGYGYAVTDDPMYVTDHFWVQRGFSWESFLWSLRAMDASNWHPLTWISYLIETSLFGMHAGPRHLFNLCMHIANSWLLYFLAWGFTRHHGASLVAALLLVVHPLHVESVAWISQRKDVMCGFFFLASLIAYAGYSRRPGPGRYLASLGCFALALMSKPMAVSLPVILLLMDWLLLGRLQLFAADPQGHGRTWLQTNGPVLLEKVPFIALSIGSALMTLLAQQAAMSPVSALGMGFRIGNALVSYATYLRDLLLPTQLAFNYPIRDLNLWLEVVPSAGLLLVITATCVWAQRRSRWPLFAWLWFLVTLAPVIGIVQVGSQSHADRYMYIPAMGIYLCIAAFASRISASKRSVAVPAGLAVLVFYGFMAWIQVGYWSSPHKLWSRSLEVAGNSMLAHNALFMVYSDQGKYGHAAHHATQLINLYPRSSYGFAAMGLIAIRNHKYAAAEHWYRLATARDQDNRWLQASYFHALGVAAQAQGRRAEARAHYQRAIDFNPDSSRTRRALRDISRAVRESP